MKNKLLQIINHYRISNQQRKFVEECYELLEAIVEYQYLYNHYIGDKARQMTITKEHITEEIADVIVMLKQFKHYYGIEDKQVEEIMNYKIDRQLDRIKKENSNVKD